MTPELRMAQFLSADNEKQKLAQEMSKLSIEELEALVKESGVVLPFKRPGLLARAGKALKETAGKAKQFGKDVGSAAYDQRGTLGFVGGAHVGLHAGNKEGEKKGYRKGMREGKKAKTASSEEKIALADEWGRELAQKEKAAFVGGDDLVGGAVGHSYGRAQRERGEPYSFKGKQLGSLLLPGGAGYQVGRYLAHNVTKDQKPAAKKPKKEKKASTMGSVSEGSKILKRVSDLWTRHGPAVKNVAGKVGKGAMSAVKAVGERIGKIENPIPRGAAAGATVGGVAGGIQGLVSPDRDPYTGEKKRIKTMLSKGTAGAMTGAATGALTGAMQKSSSVQKLEAAMTKRAAGVLGGGGLGTIAKNFVASAKPVAQKAMAAAKPHVATMAKNIASVGPGQMAKATGAAGAIGGAINPGHDAQGRTKSRIGGALKGGVSGALGGAGMVTGAKALSARMR